MRLILVRHAQSDHGRDGLIPGKTGCPGLTEAGFQQAERLAQRLRKTQEASGCACLVSSPLLRARQTAELIHAALPAAERIIDDDLCELFYGQAVGLTRVEFRARYAEFDLPAFPRRLVAPGGESWDGFLARVQAVHHRYAAAYPDGCVLAVTHAGFIVAALLKMFEIPPAAARAWLDPAHAALTEWEYSHGRWVLLRYNDTAHLSTC